MPYQRILLTKIRPKFTPFECPMPTENFSQNQTGLRRESTSIRNFERRYFTR
ncbi:hypothetical protein OOU_Y34scaffold00877g6 [Pyricularia oryzae Y34]|uniref:Uncharacterized protein n=1 Tax=Pyricularia oryzae (strain Y34) TaxID=1143189 RepID=A0AA97PGJ7_PYRO3|nr:hypothetical protein OOU_Y34scaffold00877g6 [Pyricularia oryzae Y34]